MNAPLRIPPQAGSADRGSQLASVHCHLRGHLRGLRQNTAAKGRRWARVAAPAAKMHVPRGMFGGSSPEGKAAGWLISLFTSAAVRIVLYQLRDEVGDVPTARAYRLLEEFLANNPIRDADAWLAKLMEQEPEMHLLGVRVMEVREAYCREFDWEGVQELASRRIKEGNVRMLRQYATAQFGASLGLGTPGQREEAGDGGDMACHI